MAEQAHLNCIEIHHVPRLWAEERGERFARALGAGSVLVLPEAPQGPAGKMQVILFPHPDDIPDPNTLNISNITDGDITWQ
jgi:hypothetical protein